MIDILKAFINDFTVTEYVLFLIGVILSFVGLIKYTSNQLKTEKNEIIEKHLITQETIDHYVRKINNETTSNPSIYKQLLNSILNYLDNFFGELKLFSLEASSKHYLLSLIYSFFFFYFAWLLGGDSKIGELTVFNNNNRIIVSLILLFEIVCIYLFFKYIDKIMDYIANKITLNSKYNILLDTLLSLVVSLSLVLLLIGVARVLVGVGIGVVLGALGIGVGVSLKVIKRLEGGVVVKQVLELVFKLLVFAELIIMYKISSDGILIVLFFLFLPFINSIFDYISMYASRYFAKQILKTNSKIKIFVDAILDLVVAVVLLYLLALTLYMVLDAANLYILKDSTYHIPIESYKAKLIANPFSKDVLWITLMFFSTLIPTIIHLYLATYALLAYFITKPHLHELVSKLKTLKPNDPDYLLREDIAKKLVSYRLAGMIKVYLFLGVVLILAFSVAFVMLLLKKGFL
jgi:hypothetical protein